MPPVVLIGFMGAGKTTVGRELDGEAIDSDREIERRAGKSIPEIFAEGGESGFRRFEEEVVLDLISRAAERSATGSGIGAARCIPRAHFDAMTVPGSPALCAPVL